jgi:hypothetical protein
MTATYRVVSKPVLDPLPYLYPLPDPNHLPLGGRNVNINRRCQRSTTIAVMLAAVRVKMSGMDYAQGEGSLVGKWILFLAFDLTGNTHLFCRVLFSNHLSR